MRPFSLFILCTLQFLPTYSQYNLEIKPYPANIKTLMSTYYFNDSLYQDCAIHFNKRGQETLKEYYLVGLNIYGTWIRSCTGWKKHYYNEFDSVKCVVSYNRPRMYSMIVEEKDSCVFEYDKNRFLSKVTTYSVKPSTNPHEPTIEYYFPPNDSIIVWGSNQYTNIYDTTYKTIIIRGDTIILKYLNPSVYGDRIDYYHKVKDHLVMETHYIEDGFKGPLIHKEAILYSYSPGSGYTKIKISLPEKGRKFTYYVEEKYNADNRIEYINQYRDDENKEERKNLSEFLYEPNEDGTIASINVTVINSTGYYYNKKTRYYYTYY